MSVTYGVGSDGVDAGEENGLESEVKALTPHEAAELRKRLVKFSPWHVIAVQAVMGLLLVSAVWFGFDRVVWVKSAAYGVLAVLVPSMLLARGLARQQGAYTAGAALAGLFVWEFVKIALTLVMLFAAPRVVSDLNWLALLAGFVVTMKASWFAVFWQYRRTASLTVS